MLKNGVALFIILLQFSYESLENHFKISQVALTIIFFNTFF